MRSLIVALVPVLALSFGVVACGEDEAPAPATEQQQQGQAAGAAEGDACAITQDCQNGLTCAPAAATGVATRGLPGCGPECGGPDDSDDSDNDDAPPPVTKGKPGPDAPAVTRGRPTEGGAVPSSVCRR